MDRIKLLLEEKKDLSNIDIRCLHLNADELKEWESHNILYNTLWFYLNKEVHVEFSQDIWVFYKSNISYFCNWKIVEHYNGNKLIPPSFNNESFSADIMTGWWNPFKRFVGLTGNERENLSKLLFNKSLPSKNDNKELLKWFQDLNSEITAEHLNYFIEFLKVVYTIGNIIPAPVNWRPGRGLDNFDAKLDCIFSVYKKEKPSKRQEQSWVNYIENHYNNIENTWKNFISKNLLDEYFDGNNINFFWTHEKDSTQHIPETIDDWAEYFKNATTYIRARNKKIQYPKGDK